LLQAALSAGVLTVVKTEVNTGTTAAPLSPVKSVYWARLNPGTGSSFLCVDGTPGEKQHGRGLEGGLERGAASVVVGWSCECG